MQLAILIVFNAKPVIISLGWVVFLVFRGFL
jgi:hypothetical protein